MIDWHFIWIAIVLPGITSLAISYFFRYYWLRKLKMAESPYQIGTEVRLHTGQHEGKTGIILALLTLETGEGKETQAGIGMECGCLVAGEPLTNLEVVA